MKILGCEARVEVAFILCEIPYPLLMLWLRRNSNITWMQFAFDSSHVGSFWWTVSKPTALASGVQTLEGLWVIVEFRLEPHSGIFQRAPRSDPKMWQLQIYNLFFLLHWSICWRNWAEFGQRLHASVNLQSAPDPDKSSSSFTATISVPTNLDS